MNNRPPNHRYPPITAMIALLIFCWGGLWLLIAILETYAASTP